MKILQRLSLILGFTCMAPGCHVSPEPTAAAKVIFRYNEPQGIQSLDPTDALHLAHLRATSMLTETLVKPDGSPGLASSWSSDERKMRWHFTLRSGVLFHPNASGFSDTLSSNDVLASFQRLKTKPRAAWILHPVAEMKVETDSTLIFDLNEPDAMFYLRLATPLTGILSQRQILENPSSIVNHPLGTGPFSLMKWVPEQRLILANFSSYWQGKVGCDRVAVYFLKDAQTAFLEFLAGRLEVLIGIQPAYRDRLLDGTGQLRTEYSEDFIFQKFPFYNTEYLGFRVKATDHPLAKYPALRRAYAFALDRQALIRELRANVGTVAQQGMIPEVLRPFPSEFMYDFYPDSVLPLLQSCGFAKPEDVPLLTLYTDPAYTDIATAIVGQWRNFGLASKTEVVDRATLKSGIANGRYTCFRASWIADYPDPRNYYQLFYGPLETPKGPNYTQWNQPNFNKAFEAFSRNPDEKTMVSMEKQLYMDMPVIPLWYDQQVVFFRKNGVKPDLWPNGAWNWDVLSH
jgi:ABC-type transport system substrate-binding protein